MTGEATANNRPVGSLLETVLDFNTATKLPPTITQERSNNIEAMIKQRIMDELFDDPIRKYIRGQKGGDDDDNGFDFTKSKKGLGELYEDDYRKKLLKNDPSAFLLQGNDLTGADATLKKEISGLMRTLFYQLDQLSNLHFTPRPAETEAGISTQNVPSLMIEDAIPIAVNVKGQSKSARETFSINNQKLREKSELSKEERHRERATRKRKIKSHLKHKELNKKEKRRDQGVAMHDRFEQR
jgi:U3 small nucleolar RNA-associated protein MPP10